MGAVALLVVLALILAGVGVIATGLKWLLILALVSLVAGAVLGARLRGRAAGRAIR